MREGCTAIGQKTYWDKRLGWSDIETLHTEMPSQIGAGWYGMEMEEKD